MAGVSDYSSRSASPLPMLVLVIFAIIVGASVLFSAWLFWTLLVLFLIYLAASVRILPEYRRGVLLTLGRYDGVVGPGVVVIVPLFQNLRIVDLRIRTLDIPPQEVITKDNVSVRVNGVVFYRVVDPAKAVLNVKDYAYATSAVAQTTLRDVVGGVELDELLENRDAIAQEIRKIVDAKTDEWGIDITEIRLQDITLPDDLKRAIAIQAEAEREKRAVIIKAEGDLAAANNYAKAAEILAKTPGALTLRTLQTLSDLSKDPSQKFFFVVPLELLESWIEARKSGKK